MAKKTSTKKTFPIYDAAGNKTGKTMTLPKEIFDLKANDKLLATYVRVYLNNKRAWSAVAMTRSEVTASKRKIWRQKGTGRARHGAVSAPIFVGGGAAHGPKAKNIKLKLNKKQTKKALFDVLSKAKELDRIYLISDSIYKIEPKTKKIEKLLKKLNIYGKKTLLVYSDKKSENLRMSARNIKNIELSQVNSINAYQVLSNEILLFTQDSLSSLSKHFVKNEN